MAADIGDVAVDVAGFGLELSQWLTEWGSDYRSGFSPEDIPSNTAGSNFGDYHFDPEGGALSDQLDAYLDGLDPVSPGESETLSDLPKKDEGGATGGTSSAASQPDPPVGPPSEQRSSSGSSEYMGYGGYKTESGIIVQGPGPKL